MDRINHNKIQNTEFGGIKPPVKGTVKMEEQIKVIIENILKRAEREVPEYGEFKSVYEEFKNTDNKLRNVTEFKLRITKPPKNIEGNETMRYLELAAYNSPSPYVAERVICAGSKDEILKELKNPDLYEKIKEKCIKLSDDMSSI